VRWVDVQEQHKVENALGELGDPGALGAWDACKAREDRTRSSVYGTAETLLDPYADPRVAENAESCEIDLAYCCLAITRFICMPRRTSNAGCVHCLSHC
jgi:type IV secretory pathway TraG/TraD family ATPase VirD4